MKILKNDTEVKKIIFKGNPTQMADLMGQFREIRNEEGDSIFDGSTIAFARVVINNFCKQDGASFMENSIRKYLTSYQNGKRSSKKNQIDISEINLLED